MANLADHIFGFEQQEPAFHHRIFPNNAPIAIISASLIDTADIVACIDQTTVISIRSHTSSIKTPELGVRETGDISWGSLLGLGAGPHVSIGG